MSVYEDDLIEEIADWREHAVEQRKRIEELEQIVDACEAANLKHLQRIDKMESLVKQMWAGIDGVLKDEVTMPYLHMGATDMVRKMKDLDLWEVSE